MPFRTPLANFLAMPLSSKQPRKPGLQRKVSSALLVPDGFSLNDERVSINTQQRPMIAKPGTMMGAGSSGRDEQSAGASDGMVMSARESCFSKSSIEVMNLSVNRLLKTSI